MRDQPGPPSPSEEQTCWAVVYLRSCGGVLGLLVVSDAQEAREPQRNALFWIHLRTDGRTWVSGEEPSSSRRTRSQEDPPVPWRPCRRATATGQHTSPPRPAQHPATGPAPPTGPRGSRPGAGPGRAPAGRNHVSSGLAENSEEPSRTLEGRKLSSAATAGARHLLGPDPGLDSAPAGPALVPAYEEAASLLGS